MNKVNELKVKMQFEEWQIGEGDEFKLEIEVLGQRFIQSHRFIPPFTVNPEIFKRHKAATFGRMLHIIAEEIEMQAEHGKPGKMKVGDKDVIFF